MVGQKLPALPVLPGTANSPHKSQTQSSTDGSGVWRNPIFCHSASLREQWLSSTLIGKYLFKIGQLWVSEKGEAKLICHSSMVRNSPMGWLWRARKPGPGTKGHREKHPFSLESWTRLYRLKVSLETDSPGQTQALEQLVCDPCFIAGDEEPGWDMWHTPTGWQCFKRRLRVQSSGLCLLPHPLCPCEKSPS